MYVHVCVCMYSYVQHFSKYILLRLLIDSGAYDDEQAAAHAYDLAALKYWGHETILNFPVCS